MIGTGPWPMTGEIDILEDVNGLSKASGTLHCGYLTHTNPDGGDGPGHENRRPGQRFEAVPSMPAGFPLVLRDRRTGATPMPSRFAGTWTAMRSIA
jgi:hypothetical protein